MAKGFKRNKAAGNEPIAKAAGGGADTHQTPSAWHGDWTRGLIMVAAVFLAYQPVWYAGFICDDDYHVRANPCIVGPLGLKEIWTTNAGLFFPLTLTTFWIVHALWGLAPLPYHLMNVFQHALSAVVLWQVLRHLQLPGAWLGAALWALHPIQVETVAWISELKNTQSGLFYLLTILFYLKWRKGRDGRERSRDRWSYSLTLLCAALAMASKTPTMVLPLVLGLGAWWMEGRWDWRILKGLAPLIVMSTIACAVTLWNHPADPGALETGLPARSWPERVATAGDVTWFYLAKLAWPYPLLTVYPRWQIDEGWWGAYVPTAMVVGIGVFLWRNRASRARPYFFAGAYFLITLFPFLGLMDESFWQYSFVQDHLQYLSGMAPLALAGAGLDRLFNFAAAGKPRLAPVFCAGLLLIPATMTWRQTWFYENLEALWNHTLAWNPECWVGHNDLGFVLYQKGQMEAADAEYQKALAIKPDFAEAHNNLGVSLFQKGRVDEAIAEFQKALGSKDTFAEGHNNLGNALLQKGQVDAALTQFQKAVEIYPSYAEGHRNLGLALLQKGEVDAAIIQFQDVLQISPKDSEGQTNLANALGQRRQGDEAISRFQQALNLKPNDAEAHSNLGAAFLLRGRVDEALAEFQKALEINPNDAEIHSDLGGALLQKGRNEEAALELQKALTINPNNADAHYNLGLVLYREGKFEESTTQFREALRLNPHDIDSQNNLTKVQAMARESAAPAK